MTFNPDEARDSNGQWVHVGGSRDGTPGVYDKLTVADILDKKTPARKAGVSNVEDIGAELNDRAHAALKELGVPSGVIDGPNPKTDEIISGAIASEIDAALRRDDRSAVDWYTTKVKEAMNIASVIHPEIATDPNAKFAYTAALAITSQGEKVVSNTRLADIAYEQFKKTGKFATDIVSKTQDMMNGNFGKLNALIDKYGPEKTRAFLDKEVTVKDLEKAGYKVNAENKGAKVYGSAILGPKIGQGFYQNLNGNFKPLTTDLWFMRSWGRLTGTLTGQTDVEKPKARFTTALSAANTKVADKDLLSKAEEIVRLHERDYAANRKSYDDGSKKKSELVYAADRFYLASKGLKDQPGSGGERAWIRDVFAQAQAKLEKAGHPMTIADMQATWWYPEKTLYSKMGVRGKADALNVDYSTALSDLARSKGISDGDIDKARSRK